MKHIIYIITILSASIISCSSNKLQQGKNNMQLTDNNGKPMLLGIQQEKSLKKAPFAEWYNKNYNEYKPEDSISNQMKSLLQGKKIKIFLGTWCGDSKREVPRMMRLLSHYGMETSAIELIMVDNHDSVYKQSPAHEERGLNIHRVPTFIVYEEGKELGRIVESPVESLEKDLLKIVNGEAYTPKYKGVIFMNNLFKIMPADSILSRSTETIALIKPLLKNAAELNTYGYVLMAAKEMNSAHCVFKLNSLIYPTNANIFDSLGEYYLKAGNKPAAKENYQKVLMLDPKNENAKKMLEQID
jgi:tetratricopeptide (TPR) repeat protein